MFNTIIKQELNLQLYVLWESLSCLQRLDYGNKINMKLQETVNFIEKELFEPIPSGMDLVSTKCIYITELEKED